MTRCQVIAVYCTVAVVCLLSTAVEEAEAAARCRKHCYQYCFYFNWHRYRVTKCLRRCFRLALRCDICPNAHTCSRCKAGYTLQWLHRRWRCVEGSAAQATPRSTRTPTLAQTFTSSTTPAGPATACALKSYKCPTWVTISFDQVCNYPPAVCGAADNTPPCHSDTVQTYYCGNDDAFPLNQLCDCRSDCADNTDELYCSNCAPGMFACQNNNCIDGSLYCNGVDNCGDKSDEYFGCIAK